ncbi:hypothetical protein JOB18_044733 [Solea senegalensis]|uniref:Uncharacterized protein n=1 Tax=Solea senegalensis TaxID=28829 RepID=A0AAV6SUP3_SOLSE|nr:hypothetical protein JOB18_044733 [Solea senegalensis]
MQRCRATTGWKVSSVHLLRTHTCKNTHTAGSGKIVALKIFGLHNLTQARAWFNPQMCAWASLQPLHYATSAQQKAKYSLLVEKVVEKKITGFKKLSEDIDILLHMVHEAHFHVHHDGETCMFI